jgi:hypothetical protein
MVSYDIADPDDPNTLRVPFVFVPHGAPMPLEWMAEHPGWVRFPATFVPRAPEGGESEPQWNLQFGPDEAPAVSEARPVADVTVATDWPTAGETAGTSSAAPGGGGVFFSDTAANFVAWRNARAAFADPMGAAGLRRVADTQTEGPRSYASFADSILGIGPARAAEPSREGKQADPGNPAHDGQGAPAKAAPNQARISVLECPSGRFMSHLNLLSAAAQIILLGANHL